MPGTSRTQEGNAANRAFLNSRKAGYGSAQGTKALHAGIRGSQAGFSSGMQGFSSAAGGQLSPFQSQLLQKAVTEGLGGAAGGRGGSGGGGGGRERYGPVTLSDAAGSDLSNLQGGSSFLDSQNVSPYKNNEFLMIDQQVANGTLSPVQANFKKAEMLGYDQFANPYATATGANRTQVNFQQGPLTQTQLIENRQNPNGTKTYGVSPTNKFGFRKPSPSPFELQSSVAGIRA